MARSWGESGSRKKGTHLFTAPLFKKTKAADNARGSFL
jgi:hypothetical protein